MSFSLVWTSFLLSNGVVTFLSGSNWRVLAGPSFYAHSSFLAFSVLLMRQRKIINGRSNPLQWASELALHRSEMVSQAQVSSDPMGMYYLYHAERSLS